MTVRYAAAFLLLFILLLEPHLAAAEDPITLSSIVQMQRAGLADSVIGQVVRGARIVDVDVSANGLLAMKQAGFSDALILAIVERQSQKAITSLANGHAGKFVLYQGTRALDLVPKQLETSFVVSKAKTSDEVIKYGALGAGVTATSGLISKLALAGAAGRQALGAIAGGIVIGVNALGKKPSYAQGFFFECIRAKSSTLELAQSEFDLILPVALFRDGSYATADPTLFKLDVAGHDEFRVLSSQKVKVRGGQRPEKIALGPKGIHPLNVAAEKTSERIQIHVEWAGPGEYAVAFRTGDQILPQVFDFRVGSPK